jgi:hypothetical protein
VILNNEEFTVNPNRQIIVAELTVEDGGLVTVESGGLLVNL